MFHWVLTGHWSCELAGSPECVGLCIMALFIAGFLAKLDECVLWNALYVLLPSFSKVLWNVYDKVYDNSQVCFIVYILGSMSYRAWRRFLMCRPTTLRSSVWSIQSLRQVSKDCQKWTLSSCSAGCSIVHLIKHWKKADTVEMTGRSEVTYGTRLEFINCWSCLNKIQLSKSRKWVIDLIELVLYV